MVQPSRFSLLQVTYLFAAQKLLIDVQVDKPFWGAFHTSKFYFLLHKNTKTV